MKFVRMHAESISTFEDEEYGIVNVKDKQAVDVGDTSIYFALKGAERVYAIEPHPLAYEELVRKRRPQRAPRKGGLAEPSHLVRGKVRPSPTGLRC